MDAIPVIVKHQGKRYNVDLDPSSTGETFKYQVFSLTGVEPERQKILVKGGQLKDDADLSKLSIKAGSVLMLMGTPSGDGAAVVEKPKEQIKFIEDMTEAEAAQHEGATPAGLQNLGNTCYMNSTLQALKAIPELHQELANYTPSDGPTSNLGQLGLAGLSGASDLTTSLRDLFKQMSGTQAGFPPLLFLNALRTAFPQFAQRAREGHGYAQQDAEEAWSQIVSQLRQKLKTKVEVDGQTKDEAFIDNYMSGTVESFLECDESAAKDAGEEAVKSSDQFFKLNCHISSEINHLRDGLKAGLIEKIEKKSPTLDRDAMYTKSSKISRLPKYLPVHFMRFDWRRTTNKKAKILRKVTFPQELDVLEFCTDDVRKMLVPIRDKIRDIRREEEDIERAKKRQKRMRMGEENDVPLGGKVEKKSVKKEDGKAAGTSGSSGKAEESPEESYKTDAELEAEKEAAVLALKQEIQKLADPKLTQDLSANQTGLYELRGVITHQGISADSGHYTAFIKKDGHLDSSTGLRKPEDGNWWWFNDEKVSEVDSEKINSLAGGGQAHSALILLYRAVPMPTLDEGAKTEAMDTS